MKLCVDSAAMADKGGDGGGAGRPGTWLFRCFVTKAFTERFSVHVHRIFIAPRENGRKRRFVDGDLGPIGGADREVALNGSGDGDAILFENFRKNTGGVEGRIVH